MSKLICCASALALATLAGVAVSPAAPQRQTKAAGEKVVINITAGGAKAKYVKEGEKEQKPVVVTVGQTVVWKNTDDDTHTATHKPKEGGKALFDTGEIDGGKSKEVVFDQKLFEAAGGKAGGQVELDYRCTLHPRMRASIVLKSAPGGKR